jgi:hypothetical protein
MMNNLLLRYSIALYVILAFAIPILYISACNTNTDPEEEIILPDSELNYTDDIHRLFVVKCASRNGCHAYPEPARDLDLTEYQNIISHFVEGSVPLIIPGYGADSFLYNILREDLLTVSRMPKNEKPLSANNIVGIRTWIDEGAPQFP